MHQQTTHQILMVRPANFGFNEETAANNTFQKNIADLSAEEIKEKAISEFDTFVATLRARDIEVWVMPDSETPVKPDAVFPNNWLTTHQDGTLITFPIFAKKRRVERDPKMIAAIKGNFRVDRQVQLETSEERSVFLEGTGSLILDRVHKIAYACRSVRTDEGLLDQFCDLMSYRKLVFDAEDKGVPIYHTNVMMALGETFVVICLDSVVREEERHQLLQSFAQTDKEVIGISLEQMNFFAGNMLQVRNKEGKTFLVMSTQAYTSLRPEQIETIHRHTEILHSDIRTIETLGGGSARCMMAELFLPKR